MKPADLLLQFIQVTPALTAMSNSSRRMNPIHSLGLGGASGGQDGRTIRRRLEREALKSAKKKWGKQ